MLKFLPRNITIPTKYTRTCTTAVDGQSEQNTDVPISALPISIYEGERQRVKDNKLLGKLELKNISTSSRLARIEVTFDIDANSVLKVSARDKNTGKQDRCIITNDGDLPRGEIERMMAEAKVAEATRVPTKIVWNLRYTVSKAPPTA